MLSAEFKATYAALQPNPASAGTSTPTLQEFPGVYARRHSLTEEANRMTDYLLLLNLLKAGLLGELGDDDQRRERAETAVQGVTEWLMGDGRPRLAAALLRSIDESTAPLDDPVLSYADKCLVDAWPAVRNVFPERPTELLRAIVLQAAVSAAARDDDLEAVTWYVFRTVGALGVPVGRWEAVLGAEASRIDAAVSNRLDLTWLPSADIGELRMPTTTAAGPIKAPRKGSEVLKQALEPYKDNLEGYYQQVSAALGQHVPPALAGLEAAITAMVSGSPSGGELKAFAEKLGVVLRAQLKAQWAVVEASRLRETLLWWRLAAHSDVLGKRYADVSDPALCAIAAAMDMRQLSPRVAPIAVEHLLGEAMATNGGTEPSITIADLTTAWKRLGQEHDVDVNGYGLLVSAIAAGSDEVSILAVPEALTPAGAATLVFRDLQVIGLLSVHAVDLPEPES